jgi:hypothetical protein
VTWLDLTHSKAAVTGPWLNFVPELNEYRIANIQIRSDQLWLYGCLANLPEHIPDDNARDGFRKHNLALQIAVDELISLHGQPLLDAEFDDSNHMFQVARPVRLRMSQIEEPITRSYKRLLVEAHSDHLSFKIIAASVGAFAGLSAAKRFSSAFSVRP